MPTAAPPPPSRRNGAGKHYRVCMHSVIGRHLTPCSCCCCHLAAGTQNFMLMASEADNGNLNGTQSDLLATWLGFCIRRLLFYIWMSCDDDGKGSRQPASRPPSWPFTVTKLTQNPFRFSNLISEFELHHSFTPRSGKHLKRSKGLREIWIFMIDALEIIIHIKLEKLLKNVTVHDKRWQIIPVLGPSGVTSSNHFMYLKSTQIAFFMSPSFS